MNKVLITVDGTKASSAVLSTFNSLVRKPETVVLMHVERLEGSSKMIDMLGKAEMSTLKEMLAGTEHKEALDRKAERILEYYAKELRSDGDISIKSVIRSGHPAEEILKVADEESVDLILLGHSGRKGLDKVIAGSVSSDVKDKAKVPVLVAKRPVMCEEPYSWRDAYAAITVTTAVVVGMFLLGMIIQRGTFLY
jgi:nucleotide-binding universal stress UspA family protein